ncbi:MAG: hypothetical protein AAF414_11330 [Pseudomonadota bacterium]
MAFHCILVIWLDDCGLVISGSFVVTETSAESFADIPPWYKRERVEKRTRRRPYYLGNG